ncbi:MAG: hydrogenase iron-sulfur subunit [Candidatus Freyarchaeota archaeon]|nr:hydrogenase iron-sulfur subunit [Candidatus Jordarchaeia archaeon]MBS7269858.1 hydrogenase iron-sulfur subunit [Candidatus Jordarchaeia archaeon]MBS7281586.1 hydrogenase iron-sulfur subunit [Candidatus Jordarchaeia archaeon]
MNATKQVEYLKQVLRTVGLSEERLQIYYCSSAEGALFAEIIKKVTDEIAQLGPNPIRRS